MRTAVFAIASARTTARAAIAVFVVLIGRLVAALGVGSGCAC